MQSPGRRTATLLVAFGGLRMVLFPIPIVTLFWKDQLGMSLADIMVLQSIFSIASVLLEFPSGYVADHLGHRAALMAAASLSTAGWVAYSFATTFTGAVIAEVALGAGMAFASGADSALLFTTLQEDRCSHDYSRWEGWVRASAQGSEAVSAAFGGYLYGLSPRLPFMLQVPVALLVLTTTGLMRQPAQRKRRRVSHFLQAWHIVRHTLIQHARLRASIFLSAALGLSTFVMVWFIQPYMQNRGIPALWFGPLWALAHLYLALVSLVSARAARRFGPSAVLLGCCILIAAGYGGLAFGTSAVAIVFYLCLMTVRGLQGPILISALQADAPEDARASVLSLNALVFRLTFALIGPALGAFADRVGLETALLWIGLAFTGTALAALAIFKSAHSGRLERG